MSPDDVLLYEALMSPSGDMPDLSLEDLLQRPEWQHRAACHGMTDLFFPERGDIVSVREAKAVCAACPVQEECRDFALEHLTLRGVWGGMSGRERRDAPRPAASLRAAEGDELACSHCGEPAPRAGLCKSCRHYRSRSGRLPSEATLAVRAQRRARAS